MEGTTSMITTCLANIPTVFNQVITMITGNDVASFFIGVPIIAAGVGVLHRVIGH